MLNVNRTFLYCYVCDNTPIFDLGFDFSFECWTLTYRFHCAANEQVSASGKAILITGCESPLAWCLARKLDELGFTIFAGFTKRSGCPDADLLKEESSGRTKILQLDVTSETQVNLLFLAYFRYGTHFDHETVNALPIIERRNCIIRD